MLSINAIVEQTEYSMDQFLTPCQCECHVMTFLMRNATLSESQQNSDRERQRYISRRLSLPSYRSGHIYAEWQFVG